MRFEMFNTIVIVLFRIGLNPQAYNNKTINRGQELNIQATYVRVPGVSAYKMRSLINNKLQD